MQNPLGAGPSKEGHERGEKDRDPGLLFCTCTARETPTVKNWATAGTPLPYAAKKPSEAVGVLQ